MILEAVLLLFSQGGTTVVLGTTAALLITEVLTGARSEQTNVLGVLAGASELRVIVGLRERLLLTDHRVRVGVEELGTCSLGLKHDRRVSELLDEAVSTLDSSIGNLGALVAAEVVPFLVGTCLDKRNNIQWVDEVDESVSNVAIIAEVDAEVHEIIVTEASLIDVLLQLGLSDLVRNVAEHDGRTDINTTGNILTINVIVVTGQ